MGKDQEAAAVSRPLVDDVRRAIDRSGYVLELQLAPRIERAGFWVRSDEQFQDQDTGKSREIDLYATQKTDVASRDVKLGSVTYSVPDTLDVHLVMECKSFSTPTVFFLRENKLPIYGRLMFGGFPSLVWTTDRESKEIVGELFAYHLAFANYHSYWTPKHVATRFARLVSRKQGGGAIEWDLEHSGIYAAVEKLCKAAASVHERRCADARVLEREHTDQYMFHMTYPVLVVAGDLYECRVSARGYALRKTQSLFLDWTVDSEKVKATLRVRVISARYLGKFMKEVVSDRVGLVRQLRKVQSKIWDAAAYEKADPTLRGNLKDEA